MGTKKAHINITIDEELNEWLDEMAAESGMNKSHFINNVLSVARDDVTIYKAIGLYDLAKAAIRLKHMAASAGAYRYQPSLSTTNKK